MRYWLFKSEPTTFSIDDLAKKPKQTEHWDGVRNYQARNFLRDEVKVGDEAFFYHSSCQPPGIAGIVKIVKAGYPDPSARDPLSHYFDPKSTVKQPIWYMVDVKLLQKFKHYISLDEIKQHPKLDEMIILRRGNRLSITPVTESQWKVLLRLGEK